MSSTPFLHVEQELRNAVAESVIPGAVLIASVAGRRAECVVGQAQIEPRPRAMTGATWFDLASLTKVLATTWLAMRAIDAGRLDPDAPLDDLRPGHYPGDKKGLSVRLLMTHAAGLPSGLRLREQMRADEWPRREKVIQRFVEAPLDAEPGTRTLYSDIGPILVGDLLEALDAQGRRLDRQCADDLYSPLGLGDLFFAPLPGGAPDRPTAQFAATEDCPWRGGVVCGSVHDENAHLLGGVAGHAGLFGAAADLERVALAFLEGDAGVATSTVTALTAPQPTVPDGERAFGWDRRRENSPGGTRLSPQAFGHTGFTGTSLWIDPAQEAYVVLLTNRVHPSRDDRGFLALRPRLHDLIFGALAD